MGFDLQVEGEQQEGSKGKKYQMPIMPYRKTPDNQVTPIKFKAIKLAKLKEHI